jgi:uncharacterized protein (TIGR03083 family)
MMHRGRVNRSLAVGGRGYVRPMEYPTYLDHIRAESARFRAVLATCPPDARVPACPDWDAGDLLWHLAEVQWFWAHVVRTRPAPADEAMTHPQRPSSYEGLLEAFDAYSTSLIDALASASPPEPAWHWSPTQTVGASYRRQAHEALIHRLDAEQTAGVVTPLDPDLAADGVLELVEVMYGGPAPAWGRIEASSLLVQLELTDVGRSVWARPAMFYGTDPSSGKVYDGPHVLAVADPGAAADAVVRGTAGDVDAWLWRRRSDEGITVSGDRTAFEAFWAAVDQPLD